MTRPTLLFELTTECDRRCPHCYNVWRHDPSYPRQVPAWPETMLLVDRALELLAPPSVTIIGGEPLLHERLFELLRHLARRRVPTALSTHGVHLGRTEARHLARCEVTSVEVSFGTYPHDGASLGAACRALLALEQAGVYASASIPLVHALCDRTTELLDRALAFGARAAVLQPLVEPRPGVLPQGIVPSAAERDSALCAAATWADRTGCSVVISNLIATCTLPERARGLLSMPCRCGRSKRVVDPSGNVRRCEFDTEIIGRIGHGAERPLVPRERVLAGCADCAKPELCVKGCPLLAAEACPHP